MRAAAHKGKGKARELLVNERQIMTRDERVLHILFAFGAQDENCLAFDLAHSAHHHSASISLISADMPLVKNSSLPSLDRLIVSASGRPTY